MLGGNVHSQKNGSQEWNSASSGSYSTPNTPYVVSSNEDILREADSQHVTHEMRRIGLEVITNSQPAEFSVQLPKASMRTSAKPYPALHKSSAESSQPTPSTRARFRRSLSIGGLNVLNKAADGLDWSVEPEQETIFGNSSGTVVNCRGTGLSPTVQWHYQDGRAVEEVSFILRFPLLCVGVEKV